MNPSSAQPSKLTNRSMPACTIIPVLEYPDVRSAVEWLCSSFGFEERLRIGDHRAQLSFGDSSIVVAGQPNGYASPANPSHSVMVRVADVDAHYECAQSSGAKVTGPPADFLYGERQYSVEDPAGHIWTFSQTTADVDPASWGGILFK